MRAVLTRLWRVRKALILYAGLLLMGLYLGDLLRDIVIPEVRPMNEPMMHRLISLTLILFVVTAALPFVPGAEIGLALLMVFGGKAAAVVYLSMIGALTLSFSVARVVPLSMLSSGLSWLGLRRAARFADELDALPRHERLSHVLNRVPSGPGEMVVRNRYLALAIAINVPGNSLVGGGGGLAFVAGASGLFSFPAFLLTIMLAVAPVPLFFAFS
ncbi:MAG: hypothetical protein HKN98_16225 [Silicimonas sp.]|nr:hypothetical protein [Silicimonas sp.]